MKVIVILEKYGGFCNRLFQSIHYHAYAIENQLIFINPSIMGILKFDNYLFFKIDKINNFFLSMVGKLLFFIFKKNDIYLFNVKNNYIRIVRGWNFRVNNLTKKHYIKLNNIYRINNVQLQNKLILTQRYFLQLKTNGKFLVGLHIRRGDYKVWDNGKYFFSDNFYMKVVENLKMKLLRENKDPFFIVVSDEKVESKIKFDFFSNGSWHEDQIVLQNCNLLVGPPSTFTMWASYISQIPLIQLKTEESIDLNNWIICDG